MELGKIFYLLALEDVEIKTTLKRNAFIKKHDECVKSRKWVAGEVFEGMEVACRDIINLIEELRKENQ